MPLWYIAKYVICWYWHAGTGMLVLAMQQLGLGLSGVATFFVSLVYGHN